MDRVEFSAAEEKRRLEMARREKVFLDYLNSDEYRKAIETRAKLYDACLETRKDYILSRTRIYQLCQREESSADGAIFFIENFGFTYSPKTEIKHLPFILFEFQRDAIRKIVGWIENGEDGIVEKSREMGASWLLVYVALWFWIFRDGVNVLFGSYKEALVDDFTIDSLFGKLEYAFKALPKWLKPKRFSFKKHRSKLKLKNPENGNLISGDTMNPNFGRGSRKTFIVFDEMAFWDYAKDAWEGAADSSNCRIGISTPNGYNFFAMTRQDIANLLTLHWKDHPLKNDEWYEFEKIRRTPESLAQEIDISYSQSLVGRVYPDWVSSVEKGYFPYDPFLPLYVGIDFGMTDDTAIIWAQPFKGKLRIVDTYRNTGKLIDFYIPFFTGIAPSDINYTPRDLEKIRQHKDWKRGTCFGDPAGRFSNQISNETVISRLKQAGIIVNFHDSWKEFHRRKTAARLLILDGIQLNLNEDVKYFDVCMTNAAYPKIKYGGMDEVKSVSPLHNYTSHYRSAFEYLALGLSKFRQTHLQPKDRFPKGGFSTRRAIRY